MNSAGCECLLSCRHALPLSASDTVLDVLLPTQLCYFDQLRMRYGFSETRTLFLSEYCIHSRHVSRSSRSPDHQPAHRAGCDMTGCFASGLLRRCEIPPRIPPSRSFIV